MSITDDVLALLRAVSGLGVYDAYVTDSDEQAKTISAPLPYVVVYPTPSTPESRSVAGAAGAATHEFRATYVGRDRRQAEWAMGKGRAALDDALLSSQPGKPRLRRTDDSLPIDRDDTWNRPDGGPLMYGSDRYATTTTT